MPGPHVSESCCANSGNPCSHQPPRPHQLPPARNLPRPKNSPRGCFCPAVRWTRGPGFSIPARVTFYARHLLKSAYKEKSTTSNEVVLFGEPNQNKNEPRSRPFVRYFFRVKISLCYCLWRFRYRGRRFFCFPGPAAGARRRQHSQAFRRN